MYLSKGYCDNAVNCSVMPNGSTITGGDTVLVATAILVLALQFECIFRQLIKVVNLFYIPVYSLSYSFVY